MPTFDKLNKDMEAIRLLCARLVLNDDQAFPIDAAVLTEMERPIWLSFWSGIVDRVHWEITGSISLTELRDDELSELKKWVLLVQNREIRGGSYGR